MQVKSYKIETKKRDMLEKEIYNKPLFSAKQVTEALSKQFAQWTNHNENSYENNSIIMDVLGDMKYFKTREQFLTVQNHLKK